MHKIKVIMSKMICKICGINWKAGNAVMDILGYDNYVKVMTMQKEKIKK